MTQKKAIIIGATSGIGLEMVKVLTSQGWQVGIAGRRQAVLQQNLDVVATECIDITQKDAPQRLLSLIGKTGGMDLYFHSSGIGYQNPSLLMDEEMATVATNVTGFTQMVGTAFHYFAEHPEREAHLAVISSIAGTKGLGAAPSYSSSKRYIAHYMECLEQLCHIRHLCHIHLHDIRPGFVRTALLADGHHYPVQLDPQGGSQHRQGHTTKLFGHHHRLALPGACLLLAMGATLGVGEDENCVGRKWSIAQNVVCKIPLIKEF